MPSFQILWIHVWIHIELWEQGVYSPVGATATENIFPKAKKKDFVSTHRFPTTKSKLRQLMEISNCTARINAKGMSLFILYLTFCDDLVIPVLNVCFDNSNDSKVAKQ